MTLERNPEWIERDLAVLWHPCTQMKDHEWLPMVPIRRGRGAWLEDMDGRRYLDAVSSWWVNLFGHANPIISGSPSYQNAPMADMPSANATGRPMTTQKANRPRRTNSPKPDPYRITSLRRSRPSATRTR